MSNVNHKTGVTGVNQVTRKLKLSGVDEGKTEALVIETRQLPGMDTVEYLPASVTLICVYDAAQCGVDAVEKVLNGYGAQFASSIWNRLKIGYFRFIDQNIKDNAAHQPHCCNKVPRQ